jgi:hypothetical protein
MKTARSCERNRNFVTEFSRSHYDFLKRGDFVANVEIGMFRTSFPDYRLSE